MFLRRSTSEPHCFCFRLKFYRAGELAMKQLENAQGKIKKIWPAVLALLPLIESPFQAKYSGPVVQQDSDLNYLIETPGCRKSVRLFHVNLLKPYYTSEHESSVQSGSLVARPAFVEGSVLEIPNSDLVEAGKEEVETVPDGGLLQGCLKNSETLKKLDILVAHL